MNRSKRDGHHVHEQQVVKKCQGSVTCVNGACALYKKQLRPPVEQKLIMNKCIHCNNAARWIQRAVALGGGFGEYPVASQMLTAHPSLRTVSLMLFFNNMCFKFKARIGGFKDNVSRIHHCSETHEHNYISDTRFADLMDIDGLMRDFLFETQEYNSEEEQEKEFCSVLLHHLVVREKKFPCTYKTDF
ncbi:uncharacterized protein EV154DRAFT_532282 [Mucor mucedo]|uniref:uncharacterized protein n=1 Tax=Mucor mucedo TaxID=29922 RepID=UPI00221EC130|nr:uncharacterized protein EV154DRAFT_532282 [Mucor mucedo]KAI7867068.1 hypothetical protein EV154DRAFT_532282 [Mucor mucedo]